ERCHRGDAGALLAELREHGPEVVLLSTCNRFEVYAAGEADPDGLAGWVGRSGGIDGGERRRMVYVRSGRNAAKHLFFVTSSLDSLVLGETQVRGQVKDAYAAAVEGGTVGPVLHALFQEALRVSKEITRTTGVGRGSVSVAGAAVDLAERVFGRLDRARAVVLGAGETAELVVTHLRGRGVSRLRVLNRTLGRAQALAAKWDAEAAELDEAPEQLAEGDVVVAAAGPAGAADRLLGVGEVRAALRRRRGRPLVLLDIAVPRAVDPAVDTLDNVYRYDMDALTGVTADALRHRRRDFVQCCTMVDTAALRLEIALRSQEAGGVIAALEQEYLGLGEAELRDLQRRLPGLGEAERTEVSRSFRRLVRKFLHMPVRALRGSRPEETRVVQRAFSVPRKRDG
ncbi:MAG: glutamyl-tRNA reductase, partial [Planctomycetota bacterium]